MLRPLQLRAAAEDAALMTPSAMALSRHYRELKMPVTIITAPMIRLPTWVANPSACTGNCRTVSSLLFQAWDT